MEVEDYVAIGFCSYEIVLGDVVWRSKKKVKIIDIPRWLYDLKNTQNRLSWILSRYRYLDRKHYYDTNYSFYCRKTGLDLGMMSAYSKVKSLKATLTKYENKLTKYKKEWQPTLLLQNIEDDEPYKKAIEKISSKKFELRNAETDLEKEKKLLETV